VLPSTVKSCLVLTSVAQGRPFREGIRENPALYYGLLGASAVAVSGATDFVPELNRWLQIVEMADFVRPVVSSSLSYSLPTNP
jgi:hypothetical protein